MTRLVLRVLWPVVVFIVVVLVLTVASIVARFVLSQTVGRMWRQVRNPR